MTFKASVLLVEDDPSVREVLCEALERAGYKCDCLGTFKEALDSLVAGEHDLMVADVRLPDGMGYDLMGPARDLGRKVMLITGHFGEMDSVVGTAESYLFKPFALETFIAEVERQLRTPLATRKPPGDP
jgi:two-component system OmpR family response regulator